jgi:hypothetical protein
MSKLISLDLQNNHVIIESDILINNKLIDYIGSSGSSGQILSSTGDKLKWVDNTSTDYISHS